MLKRILQFCGEQNIVSTEQKLLLAVSGGIDSMVMLDLFSNTDFNIGVAHVNYQLRKEASDLDEKFVFDTCQSHSIPVFIKKAIKPENINLQAWARNVRYDFFNYISTTHNYAYILTAHHQSDQVETILLSVFKGYEPTKIETKSKNRLRPLLGFTKEEIIQYAKSNNVKFREDLSNKKDIYDRNFLRNQIIPKLTERFPNLNQRIINRNNKIIRDQKRLTKIDFNLAMTKLKWQKSSYLIDIILEEEQVLASIFSLLSELGFSEDQLNNAFYHAKNGSTFFAKNYSIIKSKNQLFLGKNIADTPSMVFQNESELCRTIENEIFSMETVLYKGASIAKQICIDKTKITFPLTLRIPTNKDKIKTHKVDNWSKEVKKLIKESYIDPFYIKSKMIIVDACNKVIIPNLCVDKDLKINENTKNCFSIHFGDKSTPFLIGKSPK